MEHRQFSGTDQRLGFVYLYAGFLIAAQYKTYPDALLQRQRLLSHFELTEQVEATINDWLHYSQHRDFALSLSKPEFNRELFPPDLLSRLQSDDLQSRQQLAQDLLK